MKFFRCIRDVLISGVSLFGLSFVYRFFLKRKGPLVRVVVFHEVRDVVWFQTIIECLHTHYHVIAPQDFLASQFDHTRINVLVTFDDGYSSWVDVCLPILDAVHVKALFFVNSGLVDVSGDSVLRERYVREQLLVTPRAIISWDGVRTLQGSGHTIGGHTVTHPRLALLQEREQRAEIVDDKAQTESHIGTALTCFAYPFGQAHDYNEMTKRLVRESGYAYAFTTKGSFVSNTDPYLVPRLCLETDMSKVQVRRWIEGGYDIYQKIKTICVR